ncbi:TRAP transporter small permease [candidate division CSSED10-310 bacterium]|uniref:TRAP transporter small permease n=1 Tax=candidate division CSSED10-310 bacterium TaxID=2855610 RepID=A0ABV6YTF0_UNCC1
MKLMKIPLQILNRLNELIARVETWLLVLIVMFVVSGAFIQVFLRNFFNFAIEGGDIFLRHLVLWIGFIGASLATKEEKHITIDVLTRLSGPTLKKTARVFTFLFAIIISLLLARAGWIFVVSEHKYEVLLFGSMKAWYLELIIPVGFLLIGCRFFVNLLNLLFQSEEVKST